METGPVFFRPLGGVLGAEIRAIDLSSPASPVVGDALARALAEYGVLFGCGHVLGPGGVSALAALFGPDSQPVPCDLPAGAEPARIARMTDPRWRNEIPAALLLHAKEVPSGGGESIWSSLPAAYETLSIPMRRYLATLAAAHTLPQGGEEIWRPLVATDPLTGRGYLAISPDFTSRLGGVPEEEGEAILGMLRNLLYLPENQIRVPWTKDMFALWDCRIVHHYAVGGFASAGWRFSGFCLGVDPQPASMRTG